MELKQAVESIQWQSVTSGYYCDHLILMGVFWGRDF